jgi:hypothetical protein
MDGAELRWFRAGGFREADTDDPVFEMREYMLPLTAVYAAPKFDFASISGTLASRFS